MARLENMTVKAMQGYLQQILLDDHPLNAEQRYSVKSAIEMFDLVNKLSPGIYQALESASNVSNKVPV